MRYRSGQSIFGVFLIFWHAFSGYSTNATEMDYSKTLIYSSEKIGSTSNPAGVKVYLEVFRPNSDIWFSFRFPEGVTPTIGSGRPSEALIDGQLVQLRIQTGNYLHSSTMPIIEIDDGNKKGILQLFAAPVDLPKVSFEGDQKALDKLNFLLTPTVANGSFAMAIKSGRIQFFERFSNLVIAFRELNDGAPISLPSGSAKYAFLEKVELNRPNYMPGIWRLLDSDFEPVGRIASFKIFGQTVYPDGHGVTTSPTGSVVVMSYVSRRVDSSWLNEPFKAPILDCVFSQLRNGKATNSFSVWNWLDSNREFSKRILDLGDRLPDTTRVDLPIDYCHANSIIYSKALNSYIVSLRNLDLIMIIDSALKVSIKQFYTEGSRQHFVRMPNSTQITALGNYTAGANSKFQTWTKTQNRWQFSEIDIPTKLAYCGNAQAITDKVIWVGGGCVNFEKDTAGILFTKSGTRLIEKARLKLVDAAGSYRVDLYNP